MNLPSENNTIVQAIKDLHARCGVLLNEIDTFKNHVQSHRPEQRVKLNQLEKNIKADLRSLTRFSKKTTQADNKESIERIGHAIRSSNVPFYETVWATAKRSRGVVSFGRRYYLPPSKGPGASVKQKRGTASVLVDIVVENRKEWIKVSNITETRLLFEMAEKGWEQFEDSSSNEEEDGANDDGTCDLSTKAHDGEGEEEEDDDDETISIVRMAEQLARISKATRVKFRHPRVRLVLPKLYSGRVDQIDAILVDIRKLGVIVETAETLPSGTPPELTNDMLERMIGNEFNEFSTTLNIDCTILLALVSDLSHTSVAEEEWFDAETLSEIECEKKRSLLPSLLYPAVGARTLVCTREAATRFREIVETIGTESEKKRAAILMGESPYSCLSSPTSLLSPSFSSVCASLRTALQGMSKHTVPQSLQLPIRVVDATEKMEEEQEQEQPAAGISGKDLPAVATSVAQRLSNINQSVFLYGWRTGYTTLTSNRTVAKKIESLIEDYYAAAASGGRDVDGGVDRGLSTEKRSDDHARGTVVELPITREDDTGHHNHQPTRNTKEDDDEEMIGPDMWICPTARSLIGKARMWYLQDLEAEEAEAADNNDDT